MHDEIKRFSREGEIRDDSDFIRIRHELTKNIHQEMRDCGFVPVLDLNIHWSTKFISDKKRYSYVISAYGVFIGGDDLCRKGMVDGKVIVIS